jgi:hypothetical protein
MADEALKTYAGCASCVDIWLEDVKASRASRGGQVVGKHGAGPSALITPPWPWRISIPYAAETALAQLCHYTPIILLRLREMHSYYSQAFDRT